MEDGVSNFQVKNTFLHMSGPEEETPLARTVSAPAKTHVSLVWKKESEISTLQKKAQALKEQGTNIVELKETLEKILEISSIDAGNSTQSACKLDLAEIYFSQAFPTQDREKLREGRKFLLDVIGNPEFRNKALVALAKSFTAEATMKTVGNFKRLLSLMSLALLEISGNQREALAGEHFISGKNMMIGNCGNFVADFGTYKTEWELIQTAAGIGKIEISDLSVVDHFEACLRLSESERLQGLAHLELAKFLGQDRKNERKFVLALRHSQKAFDLLASENPNILAEAVRVLANLHTRKDVKKSLEILCDAEISGVHVRDAMLDVCRIMLLEIPDGRLKDTLKAFYALALRKSPAVDLKQTLRC